MKTASLTRADSRSRLAPVFALPGVHLVVLFCNDTAKLRRAREEGLRGFLKEKGLCHA